MLDEAFEALKTYDWGTDKKVLDPITEAILATRDDAGARKALESRLIAVLKTDVSRDAKDYVCRQLMVIGTAQAVPALAPMLAQAELSHMARYALERIPAEEAGEALRQALPKLDDELQAGVISSLGARQDTACVPVLVKLLAGSPAAARSAALALGAIQSPAAASALVAAKPQDAGVSSAVIDASFACADALLAAGKKTEASALYKGLAGGDRPKHVRLAATRGVLACAGK